MADVVELIIKLTGDKDALKNLESLQKAKETLGKGEINLRVNANDLRKQVTDLQRAIDRLTKERNDVVFGVSGIKDAEASLTRIRNLIRENQILAQRQRGMGLDDSQTQAVISTLRDQETYWRRIQEAVKHGASGIREYDQAIARTKEQLADVKRQIDDGSNRLRDYSVAQKAVNEAIREESTLRERQKQDLEEAVRLVQQLDAEYDKFKQSAIEAATAPGQMVQALGQGISAVGRMIESLGGVFTNNTIFDTLERYATVMTTRMFTQDWGKAFERYDILSTYSDYLEMVGVSAADAEASLSKLNAGIQGIPVGLSDVAYQARMYNMYLDDLERATKLAIGLERALVAGGANEQMRNTARYEIDRLLSAGELSTSRQYRALMQGLGVSSRYLREEMGYGDLTNAEFVNALFKKQISGQELIQGLEKLADSEKLNRAIETYRTTIESGLSSIKFALTRGKANILSALNESLEAGTGKNISGWLYEIRDAINEVYASISTWIRANPERIASVIDTFGRMFDKLRTIDWASVIEGMIDGFNRLIDIFLTLADAVPEGVFEEFVVFSTIYATPLGKALQMVGGALEGVGKALEVCMVALTAYNLNMLAASQGTLILGEALSKLLAIAGPVVAVLGAIGIAAMGLEEGMNGGKRAAASVLGISVQDLEAEAKNVRRTVENALAFKPTDLTKGIEDTKRAFELLDDINAGKNIKASVEELTQLFPSLDLAIDKTAGKLTKASQKALETAKETIEYESATKTLESAGSDSEAIRARIRENEREITKRRENLRKLREEQAKYLAGGFDTPEALDGAKLGQQIAEEEKALADLLTSSDKLGRDAQTVGTRMTSAQRTILELAKNIPGFIGTSAEEALAAIESSQQKLDELREEQKKLQQNYFNTLDELFSGFGKYEPPKTTKRADLVTNLEAHLEAFKAYQTDLENVREYLVTNQMPGLMSYVDEMIQSGDMSGVQSIARAMADGDEKTLKKLDEMYAELMAGKNLESQRETLLANIMKHGIEGVAEMVAKGELSYDEDINKLILEGLDAKIKEIDRQKIIEELKQKNFKGGEGEEGSFLDVGSFLGISDDGTVSDELANSVSSAYAQTKEKIQEMVDEQGPILADIIGVDEANFEEQKQQLAGKAAELVDAFNSSMVEARANLAQQPPLLADIIGLDLDPAKAEAQIQQAANLIKSLAEAMGKAMEEANATIGGGEDSEETSFVGGFGVIPTVISEIIETHLPDLVTAMDTTATDCVGYIDKIIRAVNELITAIQRLISVLEQLRQKFTQVEYTAVQAFNRIKQSVQEAINKVQELINKLQELKGFDGLTIDVNLNGGVPEGAPEGAGNPDSSAYWSTRAHTGGLIGEKGGVSYFAEGGFAKGTDTVPAMLTPGEYVMRREAVNRLGVPFLQRLNRMDIGAAFDSIMSRVYRPMVSPSTAYNYYTTSNDNRKYSNTQHIHTNNPDFAFRIANRYAHAF